MSWLPSRKRRSSRKLFQARQRRRVRPGLEALECRWTPATVGWTGLGGDFNFGDGANWSTNEVPGASDDVVIDDGGSNAFTVNLTSGSDAVNSLVDDASLSVSGASLSIASSSSILGSLTLTSGATLNGTADLTLSGLLTLNTSSTLGLSGTTTAQGGLATGSSAYLDGGALINQGAAIQNGTLTASNGATIDNQAGATWDFQSDGYLQLYPGTAPLFTNEGTVTADAGTNATGLYLPVTNTGTITSLAGTMILGYPGMASSTTTDFDAGPDGSFNFSGNWTIPGNVSAQNVDFDFGTTTISGSLTASDTVYANSNIAVTIAGTYSAADTSLYDYASLTLDGPVTSLGDTSVNDIGTLDLDPATAQTLDVGTLFLVNDSTIEGTDNLVVSGLFTWTINSTLSLSGTTTAEGNLSVGSSAYLDGGALINQGAAIQNGTLTASNGATIDNQAGKGDLGLPERRLPSVVPRHGGLVHQRGDCHRRRRDERHRSLPARDQHRHHHVLGRDDDPRIPRHGQQHDDRLRCRT